MIYITGDTHGTIDGAKLINFANASPILTKNDYVIITGDFGGVWSFDTLINLDYYSKMPFTTLFVDGNHENFNMLNAYPVSKWKGGEVHRIRKDIIHLMRGQVYEIEGKTFFTFGGAESHDKEFRKENITWWKEEVPNEKEIFDAFSNLKKYKNKVDFIITHSCDSKSLLAQNFKCKRRYEMAENSILQGFEDAIDYKHWYFGHYHIDAEISDNKTAIYKEIIKIQ